MDRYCFLSCARSCTAAVVVLHALTGCAAAPSSTAGRVIGDGVLAGGGGFDTAPPPGSADSATVTAGNQPPINPGPATAPTTTTGAAGNTSNGGRRPGKVATRDLVKIDECDASNAAALDPATVERLKAGGSSGGMEFLYPYDGTVFPRGITAPLLMWRGAERAEAVYLRIRSEYFEYDGCLKPTGAGQLQLPQNVWDMAGVQTAGPSTPFTIELSALDGQTVQGPATENVTIAQATLKGSIYYNSYNSRLAGIGPIGNNGSVLRIRPGQQVEFFARQGACTGCHTVSANGERLITMEWGLLGQPGDNGRVYDLGPDTRPNPNTANTAANSAFVGISPDGSVYLSSAAQPTIGPDVGGSGMRGFVNATLYETDSGRIIDRTGIPSTASMPTFSADGKQIVFSDLASLGRALAVIDFDPVSRRASNQRTLYESSRDYVGWPFMLPDGGAVIFTSGSANNFTGRGAYISGGRTRGPASDLMIVDVQSRTATLLAQAMGFRTPTDAEQENTYLPFGKEELHQHYYPTVSPVAAGGYFWVFFDSVRHYGNLGMHRQLWGTAIRIPKLQTGEFASNDNRYAFDPSSPAFYLPGQELEGANHRAFTALDPCRADGESCETGVDCCSGFCTDGVCGPPRECAETNEACETDADCCNLDDRCINGFCGEIVLL